MHSQDFLHNFSVLPDVEFCTDSNADRSDFISDDEIETNLLVNNFEQLELELLEPLFSNFPSVSDKYTSKLNLKWRMIFRHVLDEMEQSKVIHNAKNPTVSPESSSDFIQWIKTIRENKWKNFVIARKKVVKYVKKGCKVCDTFISYFSFEDKYEFSKWKKFTESVQKL